MKQIRFRPIYLFLLFIVILLSTVKADEDLTLYIYQIKLTYPENAREHLLIIAHRQGEDPFPVLLYTKDGTNYAPIPLDNPRLGGNKIGRDWRFKQRLNLFVELVLGTPLSPVLKGEPVRKFQREKLAFSAERSEGNWADGDWGNATWTAFANQIRDGTLGQKPGIKVVDLNAPANKAPFNETAFTPDPSRSLAKYDPKEMRIFASRVLNTNTLDDNPQERADDSRQVENGEDSALTTRQEGQENFTSEQANPPQEQGDEPKEKSGILTLTARLRTQGQRLAEQEKQIDEQNGWIRFLIGGMFVLAVLIIALIVQVISSGRKAQWEKEETQALQSSIRHIRELGQQGGVVSQLQKVAPRIQTVTSRLDEATNLLEKTKELSGQIEEHKSQVEPAVARIHEQEAALTTKIKHLNQKSGEIDDLLKFCHQMAENAGTTLPEVLNNAQTIQGAFDHLKAVENEFRESRVAAWGQWIQNENGSPFSQAAEQLRQQQGQRLREQIEGKVSSEKQQVLQQAKELLEDFGNRMNLVNNPVPDSLQNTLGRVNSLLYQFGQLPHFEPPSLFSLQGYEVQQAEQVIAATMSNTPPQLQNYESYVQQNYSQAFKAYVQHLQEITSHPIPLTDEGLDREWRDIAFMLLNPFDSKAAADAEMRQIITYFDLKVRPPLLDALGFEEIPITIGQTQAVLSLHDIVESRPSQYPSGTVSEVLFKGFRVKGDPSGVVRKTRVIRAE